MAQHPSDFFRNVDGPTRHEAPGVIAEALLDGNELTPRYITPPEARAMDEVAVSLIELYLRGQKDAAVEMAKALGTTYRALSLLRDATGKAH